MRIGSGGVALVHDAADIHVEAAGHDAAANPVQADVRVPLETITEQLNGPNHPLHPWAAAGNVLAVAPDQRRNGKF